MNNRDKVISLFLIQVFAAVVRDLDQNLQELQDPLRSQILPLDDYVWRRVLVHLDGPLRGLLETQETAKSHQLAISVVNTLDEYLKSRYS